MILSVVVVFLRDWKASEKGRFGLLCIIDLEIGGFGIKVRRFGSFYRNIVVVVRVID